MSNIPMSILNPCEALLLSVKADKDDNWGAVYLNGLLTFADQCENSVIDIIDIHQAPWDIPQIVDILASNKRRQCLILCENISAFAIALTLMVLERGLDVYVVCQSLNADDHTTIARLKHASATVMTVDQFTAESRYLLPRHPDKNDNAKGSGNSRSS